MPSIIANNTNVPTIHGLAALPLMCAAHVAAAHTGDLAWPGLTQDDLARMRARGSQAVRGPVDRHSRALAQP
jgi:hypothetical protein